MTDGIATYVGVDWASVTHYAFALDPEGGKLGYKGFVHSGDGLAELVEWIRRTAAVEPGRVAIGIEVPHGPVVESLMEAGFQVYALNPKQLDRFRDRFTVAGAKDDRRDALVLADALRTDRQAYRLLEPMHPTIIELREWSRMTEDLSAERNRLANRFRHQLWRYFPQVIDLAEDWASLWILDLWDLIPTPARARTVRPETVAKLLKRTKVRRWTADTLLEQLRSTPLIVAPGVADACVAHCRVILQRLRLVIDQLRTALKHLDRLSAAVAAIPSTDPTPPRHHDPEILQSIPGVGPIVLAALLSEAHDAVVRRDAQALRGLSGVAPVTRRSGKQTLVIMRQSCPRRLRTAVSVE